MCETALGAAILIHHSFEGSDKLSYGCLFQGKVSIRAPARGATAGRRLFVADQPVSIRAPARGATHLADVCRFIGQFQFALPRGERRHHWEYQPLSYCFNSRSREGSDLFIGHDGFLRHGFNSRSREGSDFASAVG